MKHGRRSQLGDPEDVNKHGVRAMSDIADVVISSKGEILAWDGFAQQVRQKTLKLGEFVARQHEVCVVGGAGWPRKADMRRSSGDKRIVPTTLLEPKQKSTVISFTHNSSKRKPDLNTRTAAASPALGSPSAPGAARLRRGVVALGLFNVAP
ncbi:hypothetical protein B5M09_013465 [Aphanomyces astaci]|uniref:Uncharacterized protein n=1 Tax=Aphanomyces astaci TaxID=112090 RepID=A0A425DLS4_APHAT|nr:hypothetical protein B5M09_013465 [Aphanomyces astaci]